VVLKPQGPGARSAAWFMATCHIENRGESQFVVEEHRCEAKLTEMYWRFAKISPKKTTLSFATVLKTNQVVKPGDTGQLALKMTVEAVRDALAAEKLPIPSEWNWTYLDCSIVVRCQARGVSREERKALG